MAVWLASAIKMLAAAGAFGAGTEIAQRAFGTAGEGGAFGFDIASPFGDGKPKRRRRRRSLTASDKADIAFIVGLLGQAAGGRFAVTLAGRAR